MAKQPNIRGVIGSSPVRIDGIAKVTGTAPYAADQPVPNAASAALVMAPIARGKLVNVGVDAARAMPGVLEVMTRANYADKVNQVKPLVKGGYVSQFLTPFNVAEIFFAGQITALVIAETAEQANAAAAAIELEYKAKNPAAQFGVRGTTKIKAKPLTGSAKQKAGDLEKGLAEASRIVNACYETPAQHHNPMELFGTTCAWTGDELTVWEASQSVRSAQWGLAKQLGIKPDKVRWLTPFIGGAFGARNLGQYTALVALAAKKLDRPVKLVLTRQQGFSAHTYRAETRHSLKLGADDTGRLTALSHDSWELCGRKDRFAVAGQENSARVYACHNVSTLATNILADRQAPGFMRAPPETPYMFAMESAMDELAYALGMDPLELRRRNDTDVETVTGKPYTSRSLMRCIDRGAEVFGWSARNAAPRSMQDGDELVGWGYATAMYPTQMGPADIRVTLEVRENTAHRGPVPLTDLLHVLVEVGGHEIGTGIRTVVAQTAADQLGLKLEQIEVHVGDSALPTAPIAGGSNSTASVCSVLLKACDGLRAKLAKAAAKDKGSPLHGVEIDKLELRDAALAMCGTPQRCEPLDVALRRVSPGKPLVEEAANNPHGLPPIIGNILARHGVPIITSGVLRDRIQCAMGAQFVEVRIHRATGMIRVPRMVGVYAAGRIMNPRTARSQLQGGQVWGVGSALLEATELDLGLGRYVNDNLGEYHVAINADIGEVYTEMIEEVDTIVNPLGIKGVGELGIVGVNAAIANAVYHATGTRVRSLPIRVGDLQL